MGDISRGGTRDLIRGDHNLELKHTQILISEKQNQIKQLDLNLERMKTVDFKTLELQKEILAKDVIRLQQEIGTNVIDAVVIENQGETKT